MQRRGTSRQYRVLCTRIQSPPFPKLGWSPCVAFTFRDACSRGRAVARHPSPPRQRRSAVPGVVQVVPWRGRAGHARGDDPPRGPARRSEGLQGEHRGDRGPLGRHRGAGRRRVRPLPRHAGVRRRGDARADPRRGAVRALAVRRAGLAAGGAQFPRAFVVEKAYPEDEVVITDEARGQEFIYEHRLGKRFQMEASARTAFDGLPNSFDGVTGALKFNAWHSLERRALASFGLEVTPPLGRQPRREAETVFAFGAAPAPTIVVQGQIVTSWEERSEERRVGKEGRCRGGAG